MLLLASASAAHAAPSTTHNPHGHFLGVVKHRGTASQAPATSNNLLYWGGPVMHTNTTHAVFWAPSGFSFPSGYVSLVNRFFADVAHDSGLFTNVYSTDPQYTDGTGSAAYASTYAGPITDVQAYPTSGCPPGTAGNRCLTDSQLESEIARVISATPGLSKGLGDIYFVFTPSGVDSCFNTTSIDCSYNTFCAYHSDFTSGGQEVLYANMPLPDLSGCDSGQHPNGNPEADSVLNVTSHEHQEAMTDPLGTAWYDKNGEENADKCNFNFGAAAGTAPNGDSYNQVINASLYYLQQDWSNADNGCEQRGDIPPTAHIDFTPAQPLPGQTVAFDGSASSDPDGTVVSYAWRFGDGSTASGPQVSHAYTTGGLYHVSLTVTDDRGRTGTASVDVPVDAVHPACSDTSATVQQNGSVVVTLPCSGNGLTRSIASAPAHGSLGAVDQAAGSVVYTPQAGYSGGDSFTFAATDNVGVSSAAATATLTVQPAPTVFSTVPPASTSPAALLRPPRVSGLRVSPRSLRRGVRALISWKLDRPAVTSFRVERVLVGAVSGGRCVKRRRGDRRRRCHRFVRVAGFTRSSGVAGANSTRYSGRGLALGLYRLVAVASDAAGVRGSAARTSFRIVR